MPDTGHGVLEAFELTKRFRGVQALDGVSMRIDDGEVVGIIGPNGAGKTTLFNLVAGAFQPTSGTISFKGRDIARLPAYKRARQGIARTFQLTQAFGSMTVIENIASAVAASGSRMSRALARAEEISTQVGLSAIVGKSAAELNAVEGKRLELARALGTSPVLLLLDEIFSGLNGDEVDDLVQIVRQLPLDGLTVVLIEHNVGAIRRCSDRVIAIDAGRVVSEGNAEEVLSDPVVMESYLGHSASA